MAREQDAHGEPWWRDGVLYQVYVRSLADANGDGVGDLPGITRRLDHLADLGVDGVWLTPIYPSPMADFGYDIADFTDVHPPFGTLTDLDALLDRAHARGLRVVLDIVPNHTSDQHPWFLASRSSRDDPRRDWYVWRDPAPDGGPPTNWLSRFTGGPAWRWDARTGQYYLHTFLPEQPDLNWRNPEVVAAMSDVLRFWLDRGVDGFRVDVVYRMIKDDQWRDNPPNPDWTPAQHPSNRVLQRYTRDRPEVHGVIRHLRGVVDAYDDRLMFGEVNLPIDRWVAYYGDDDELHFPMNHPAIVAPWRADAFADLIGRVEAALPGGAWPSWYLANHDEPRVATRVGDAQAGVAMTMLLTLRGTPIVYYGDELGLRNVPIPPERVQDPWELNAPGLGLGRDPMRTPMPWDTSPHAGFCPPDATPWLPVGEVNAARSVQAQCGDPASMLSLTTRLLAVRRRHAALRRGTVELLDAPDGVLAYRRGDEIEVWLAFDDVDRRLTPSRSGRVLVSTDHEREGGRVEGPTRLAGDSAMVIGLD